LMNGVNARGTYLCTLGHAGEFKKYGIGVNSLWPRTAIATAAMQMIPGIDLALCRKPEIMADAAYAILSTANNATGNFYIDDDVLAAHGVTDLGPYAVTPGNTNFCRISLLTERGFGLLARTENDGVVCSIQRYKLMCT
jgi:hypothetical protein